MSYFNPEPKNKKNDFFNMEKELEAFIKAIKTEKFIIVTGLRRYGKTSLILTGLNELGIDYIFLDCRLLPSGMIAISDFLELLEEELSRKSWALKLLEGIEEVSIGKFGIKFKEKKRETLLNILRKLNGKVLVLDEAQELRRSRHRFDYILAYAYDHLNLKIVISGSQIGLLYRFLRINDPEAPLFGRPYLEIRLKKLDNPTSRHFLEEGFKQEGIEISKEIINEALNKLDGIIDWLVYFGYSYARSYESLDKIFKKASRLAIEEAKHALELYGVAKRRYIEALKIIATLNEAKWSDVKRGIEAKLGRIPNNTLSSIIRNLMDLGFIEKSNEAYRITDPILRNGILRFL
ncbi:MAG: ATP-binding protein [Nitrososphaerota archaeon]